MTQWLTTLHEYFVDGEPFVVATIVAYHGNSPNLPGVALFHSRDKSHRLIHSDHHHQHLLETAEDMLLCPTTYRTEDLNLGKVAGCENGYCEVVYEYFDAHYYPGWLTELRAHAHNGTPTTLLREFDQRNNSNNKNHAVRTEVIAHLSLDIKDTSFGKRYGEQTRCRVQKTQHSLKLLRTLQINTIAVTLIGRHPVADEIEKQSLPLPIHLTRIDNTPMQSPKQSPEQSLDDTVIIMTTDHELDYQHCEFALQQLTGSEGFVGCIGSRKKADIFSTRLRQSGVAEQQLKKFHMPLGIAEISGKQKSVVAASIIAQLLIRHQW